MTKELFAQLVGVLLPEMGDVQARKALVESALYGSPVLQKIQWEGAARPFAVQLVRLLDSFGDIAPGRAALGAVLEEVKAQVGTDRRALIDQLLPQLKSGPTTSISPQPAPPSIPPPPQTFTPGELDVFLSYARPDQAVAAQVEAFLMAAGVRVFRDTSDIGAGDNWDLKIEQALRECHCMVLLLSAASMPERKEVHREWFNFDQKGKKIYPLYLQDCQLHSRFDSRNYLDARTDLPGTLERLRLGLQRDFGLASVANHNVDPLALFRRARIAEWSLPRYDLDKRFVNLTLLLDKGESEPQRWHQAEDFRFNDLREVLDKTANDPALVLLGAPGSGKSTLLRRLQLDHSADRLPTGAKAGDEDISFFIQLNSYCANTKGELLEPGEWLCRRWAETYPKLNPLETYLKAGRALLLLDALNEMPHQSTKDYFRLVGLWRAFAQEAAKAGNRLVFTCRSLDYSASLSSKELRVPQIEVQPMTAAQVRQFLDVYTPTHAAQVWAELDGTPQFSLFQTPYFLKLLCEQVEVSGGHVPKGRAALFTGFVRQALQRELAGELFQPGALLDERDHRKLNRNEWRNEFELPKGGALLTQLSALAFGMQLKGLETESAQVRIAYDDACDLLAQPNAADLLKAGVALNVLDEVKDEILFFHQLLQEYFAARHLAAAPQAHLVQVEWEADKVSPSLDETLTQLADGDPLPPLPQTGWEETTLTAAPLAANPEQFIRDLIPRNLPLAARCAAAPEVNAGPALKRELQALLVKRAQDFQRADLRARIAAGEALGLLGDPRFERRTGPHGEYLLPPLVDIAGGKYPLGDDKSDYSFEKPAHTVELAPFSIGQFPVTNAEYALFMAAGGYEDEQWWDTAEARAWRRGEGSTDGSKQQWRDNRKVIQGWPKNHIPDLVKQNRITSKEAEDWTTIGNWSEAEFEQWLDVSFPSGKLFRQPEYWNDTRFNNPAQPVVGVTWFEARAYCNWLTANAADRRTYRLPTEAEFEAAARGKQGRLFPYGKSFDKTKGNTFESHIRRTTPVGIFENATPEMAFDLSGNAYAWTLSIYDQQRFAYPYRANDGRENVSATDVKRVLRGGSWFNYFDDARAVFRHLAHPAGRYYVIGFRVVVVSPPS
jgi:formylglycine-generating enzyme required for sulfatase activity